MEVELRIEYWSENVLCLDPEKVVAKLKELFPTLEVDPTDWADDEVRRVAAHLESSDASAPVKETMLAQIRGKARRNGPVLRFRVVRDLGSALTGRASRYSVSVESETALDGADLLRIVGLFESFGAGNVSIHGRD